MTCNRFTDLFPILGDRLASKPLSQRDTGIYSDDEEEDRAGEQAGEDHCDEEYFHDDQEEDGTAFALDSNANCDIQHQKKDIYDIDDIFAEYDAEPGNGASFTAVNIEENLDASTSHVGRNQKAKGKRPLSASASAKSPAKKRSKTIIAETLIETNKALQMTQEEVLRETSQTGRIELAGRRQARLEASIIGKRRLELEEERLRQEDQWRRQQLKI